MSDSPDQGHAGAPIAAPLDSLGCLLGDERADAAYPIHLIKPDGLDSFLAHAGAAKASFVRGAGFKAAAHELLLLPGGETGMSGALLGLGECKPDHAPDVFHYGALAEKLPRDLIWRLAGADPIETGRALFGYCAGAYRFVRYKSKRADTARLIRPPHAERAERIAAATWFVRDMINLPANDLGPVELAQIALSLGARHDAACEWIAGGALLARFPVIAAVGAGAIASRAPVAVTLRWQGSGAGDDAPLVSLCGKGVVFDTGGYDIKPSAAMLRMKKDMGGAAHVLGLARLVMQADLPVRLAVRIGCVENVISGAAMRPSDVLRSRHGLTIEVGNTDAEGRLVLCDLLAEAAAERPALLLDFATLTGAARVALGPDLPALFCNDDSLAARLLIAAVAESDPLWRLPLWSGYDSWLDSTVADLNNVSTRPQAGAITAALFLQRFVERDDQETRVPWAHVDVYAWNDSARPGRPEGGEAQGMRAAYRLIESMANAERTTDLKV